VLVHVYSFYVYVYLFAAAALRDLDADQLDAAADLGASRSRAFRDVVLPALTPALVGSLLLVFMLSMASFTAPLLFAGNDPFLTTLLYEAKLNDEMALSATAATVLTFACLAVLVVLELRRTPIALRPTKGAGRTVQPITSGTPRRVWAALVGVTLALVALPILTVILLSFADATTWTTQLLPERYSLEHYRRLFSEPQVFAPIRNSVWMASVATAANVVFGVAVALVVVKGRLRGAWLLQALAILPFAIPGTVIALNLIVAFSQPTALAAGNVLVGSLWLLPLAYFVRNVPLVVRAATAALEGFDDRLAEASADLGASRWTTFHRIVWPDIRPAVLGGTLLTWVAALGEFVASILLYVFGNRPIAVEMFSQLRLQDLGLASAYAVLLMALVAASAVVFRRFGAR
jgi:iron(III) transport system permease protein